MKRAFVIVIDSMGIGAMPDAQDYNDLMTCNTLANVAKYNNGLNVPNMAKLGLGNIQDIMGISPELNPIGSFGKMEEVSKGKDTTTGHWEIAGLVLDEPFMVYPEGFPQDVIDEFIKQTGCGSILANYPASGTEIIDKLGEEHQNTGYPIIYTSADSVFQIACHVDTTPLEKLYEWCEIARKILVGSHNVSRVIARPFEGPVGQYKRISAARRDYSVAPTKPTVLDAIVQQAGMVFGVGKIKDIFVKSGVTHAVHTGGNKEGLEFTLKLVKNELDYSQYALSGYENKVFDKEFIFVNLVDTDMLYGHRNNPEGYGKAIEEIDIAMKEILNQMSEDDLLIITADHGCDPTVPGTDHTREYVPVIVYGKTIEPKNLGVRKSFSDIASTISHWLGVEFGSIGESML